MFNGESPWWRHSRHYFKVIKETTSANAILYETQTSSVSEKADIFSHAIVEEVVEQNYSLN